MEDKIIADMAQRSILHTHGSGRILHSSNAAPPINGTILDAQKPAVKVGQRIYLSHAGEVDFLLGSRHIPLHGIEIGHRSRTGEDNIALLSLTFIRFIQLEGAAFADVNRIPKSDTLPCCGGKRYISATALTSINTAKAVIPIPHLGILEKLHRVIIPDTQITGCINRAAIHLIAGTARRIPAESHAHIVTQSYRT